MIGYQVRNNGWRFNHLQLPKKLFAYPFPILLRGTIRRQTFGLPSTRTKTLSSMNEVADCKQNYVILDSQCWTGHCEPPRVSIFQRQKKALLGTAQRLQKIQRLWTTDISSSLD